MTDRRLRFALLGVAAAGVAVAGYLTWVHYAGLELLCTGGGGGCGRVQGSSYASLAGVPVAVIGLGGYLAILASLLLRGEPGRLATAALALVGAAFSAYLTYLELFVIEAICQWCVASAILMICAAALACWRVLIDPEERGASTGGGQDRLSARSSAQAGP